MKVHELDNYIAWPWDNEYWRWVWHTNVGAMIVNY